MSTSKKFWLYFIIVIAIIAGAIYYSTRPKPITVFVKPVEMGDVESMVANTRAGTINACQRAKLAPTVGGQIALLSVKEGDKVKKDQILLELWNDDLKAQIQLSLEESVAAKARIKQACVLYEVSQKDADRLVQLQKKGLASIEKAEQSVGESKAKQAACAAAKATQMESEARIKVANAALERTILRAPFDGTVAEINGELGEVITPSPVGIATPPAIDLIDDRCMYVSAPIDEVDAAAIRTDMMARITLDAFPDKIFSGRVRRISTYVQDREKQARTVDIEVDFENQENIKGLLAGYSADVEVILNIKKNITRIPTESIIGDDKVYVFDNGTLVETKIRTGLSNWQYTEVISGLKAGQQVITSVDQTGVKDGARATADTSESKN
ncbi:MAG: efflux RND transporter periplasmic adaptor subunit [Gammaproteobacteria bacterium]|nr:efflux RND transporter periplasmic adaptor subunit [Gammaproteobacteria bacterium]